MNTRFSRSSLNFLITASVNVSHPVPVRTCLVGTDREDGIHRKYALAYPTIQIPGGRDRFPKIIVDLFEYIHQGAGNRHAIGYREADPVVLPRIWIGVLSQDNDFYLLKRACVKYMEYLGPGRKYVRLLIFVFDKCHQLLEIRLVKFFLQTFSPTFIYSNIHGVFLILPPKVRRKA